MGDANAPDDDKWRDFPRILIKAFTANTYFFTRLVEMSQKKQVQDKNKYLQVLLYFIFQFIKEGSYDLFKEEIYSGGSFGADYKKVSSTKFVWSSCVMDSPHL